MSAVKSTAKSGVAKSGVAKGGVAKGGAAKSGAAKSGAAKSGAAKSGAVKSGAATEKPIRDAKAIAEARKRLPPLRKNKVKQICYQIRVIKREGGTIKFAKKLRAIRKINDSKQKSGFRKVLVAQKKAKKAAAFAAVKGKTTKSGKKMKPVLKKEHQYDVKKMRKFYKTQLAPRSLPSKNWFKDMNSHNRRKISHLRRSLLPGTVCILLAGRYKCKRVIFLKQLKRSGLCLVTGPFGVNKVPLRRVNQNYMIATSLRLDMADIKLPRNLNDRYFMREKLPKAKKTDEEIFEVKKMQKTGPSAQRKADQKELDRKLVGAIKKRDDTKIFLKYLKTDFGLMGSRYPHNMHF